MSTRDNQLMMDVSVVQTQTGTPFSDRDGGINGCWVTLNHLHCDCKIAIIEACCDHCQS